jgi:hypothetical protein
MGFPSVTIEPEQNGLRNWTMVSPILSYRLPCVFMPEAYENDHSPRPSLRPILEDWVPFLSHLQATEKTLLSDRLISCEQERQAIQSVHVRLEDLTEIRRGGIG